MKRFSRELKKLITFLILKKIFLKIESLICALRIYINQTFYIYIYIYYLWGASSEVHLNHLEPPMQPLSLLINPFSHWRGIEAPQHNKATFFFGLKQQSNVHFCRRLRVLNYVYVATCSLFIRGFSEQFKKTKELNPMSILIYILLLRIFLSFSDDNSL